MHELNLRRKYRTIYMCGSWGIGGRRDQQRIATDGASRSNRAVGGDQHFEDNISGAVGGQSVGGILRLTALAETALGQLRGEPDAGIAASGVSGCLG